MAVVMLVTLNNPSVRKSLSQFLALLYVNPKIDSRILGSAKKITWKPGWVSINVILLIGRGDIQKLIPV